jgi:hypothetical protein
LCKASTEPTKVSSKEKLKSCTTNTVALDKTATQYHIGACEGDPNNEKPSACTFHALVALHVIAKNFEDWCVKIQNKKSDELSNMQKAIIKEGLIRYRSAVKVDPIFIKGADLAQIQEKWPACFKELHLELGKTDESTSLVPTRVCPMVDGLFGDPNQTRIAWIKTGNELSFAVICHQNLAIVFDSHANQISMLSGKEDTKEFLNKKLSEHATVIDKTDMTPFLYATGRIK